jgi:5-deoxy-glucuronate isomerase
MQIGLTLRIRARILFRWRSASVKPPLLYSSRRIRTGRTGAAIDLTPRTLGWRTIHFAVHHLARGATWRACAATEERCLVLLSGAFEIVWPGGAAGVGPRPDVFDAYPHAVYLPVGVAFRLRATQSCEVADCRAVVAMSRRRTLFAPQVIRPSDCGYEIRGGGNATRQIVDIMPPAFPAERLMICEVFTPSGNWSSYPPHKHDDDAPPREADLDEIYYYRYRNPDGYGFQRVYTGRRDETVRVTHGDVVAVREGYHPFVTAYGYDAYYLNVLAGRRRSMAATDDPKYARFRDTWPPRDPRLPLVTRPNGGDT